LPFISSSFLFQADSSKDSDGAFFKRLDSFQPCDIHELKPGTHFFAVYGIPPCSLLQRLLTEVAGNFSLLFVSGDNFFKSASYTIEVACGESFPAEKEKLRNVEAKILAKRAELSKFESEYREVCANVLFYISRSSSFFVYLALKGIHYLNTDVCRL
jgi:hypothetical protein